MSVKHLAARLFMVAEARQNSVAIVRKGEAAIANDCMAARAKELTATGRS
jgi:hypothetical protein